MWAPNSRLGLWLGLGLGLGLAACDPGPPFPDPVVVDPDGDGVSGACDPFPMTPGDHITLFESFRGPTLPVGWNAVGTWSFAGGNAVVTSSDGELNYLTIPHP